MADPHSATAHELSGEWNLFEMVLRLGLRLSEDDRSRLNAKLKEHLADDSFTVRLLRSAVNIAYINGRPQTRLFWKGLMDLFGNRLVEAVRKLARSDSLTSLNEEDKAAVELSLKYESGWRPDEFDD